MQTLDKDETVGTFCTNTLSLTILGQPLGDVPVAIELSGYVLEGVPDSNKLRLVKSKDAQS